MQVNPREAALAKWTRCQLSGQPLNPPCVSDELGHLFNKDAIVNALMEKTVPPALAHISRRAAHFAWLSRNGSSHGSPPTAG